MRSFSANISAKINCYCSVLTCGFVRSKPGSRTRALESVYEIPGSLQFTNPAAIDREDESESEVRCKIIVMYIATL